ncbi:MAG: hypothetical protein IJU71_03515 [Selenomonadaceae bacterium]|nr:hypothetical protein [Selenomonadaceae bacterium]
MIPIEQHRNDVILELEPEIFIVDVGRASVLEDSFEADAELADGVFGLVGVGDGGNGIDIAERLGF